MVKRLIATDTQGVATILDLVHDRAFELSKVDFVEATLLNKNVTNLSLKDEAEIDREFITHDGGHVRIDSSIPVCLDAEVSKLEVELVISDTVTA